LAAIDLLLNWSPTSERMHQVVLTGLLRHTRLLEFLGVNGVPTDLRIETQKRLYDFTVTVQESTVKSEVHIELKVDATLGEKQIKRQMAAVAEGDSLLYVLIGDVWLQVYDKVKQVIDQADLKGYPYKIRVLDGILWYLGKPTFDPPSVILR